MNVPFSLADSRLDDAFLKEAGQNGLVQLKGHRLVGGMRASDLQRHARRRRARIGRFHA